MPLSTATWKKINDFLFDLHGLRTLEEFFPYCLEEFPKLLDCPYLAWDEFTTETQLSGFKATRAYKPALEEVFPSIVETVMEHPVAEALDVINNPRPLFNVYATSDFVSDRQFRSLGLYIEAYRHVEAEYQLYTDIYFSPDHHAGISINSPRKFSEEQRATAEVVCRHIEVAYSRLLAKRIRV